MGLPNICPFCPYYSRTTLAGHRVKGIDTLATKLSTEKITKT